MLKEILACLLVQLYGTFHKPCVKDLGIENGKFGDFDALKFCCYTYFCVLAYILRKKVKFVLFTR